jgi:uncharacterized protein (TIGR04255 family)
MNRSQNATPKFANPPVVETVLGVFFQSQGIFSSVYHGIFWDRYFRDKFPKIEERPPVEEQRELFGEERMRVPAIRWQIMDHPDTPRLWAASENGEHVIQIQQNAFFANWLKTAHESGYLSYEERRSNFSRQLDFLGEFFQEQHIGQIEPTSWVVTYINHIDYQGLDCLGSELSKILTLWSNQYSDDWLSSPDKMVLDFGFPMLDQAGRLNANLTPVLLKNENKHMLRLDLTARGQLNNKDTKSALKAIDLGHEWVVRGFASLTQPEMQKVWGRIQ